MVIMLVLLYWSSKNNTDFSVKIVSSNFQTHKKMYYFNLKPELSDKTIVLGVKHKCSPPHRSVLQRLNPGSAIS
jgi:hypothetical protein